MIPRAVRFALLTALVVLSGCMTWRPAQIGELRVAPEEVPPHVRVTRSDGSQVEMSRAEIYGDSIVGFRPDFVDWRARFSVALADVRAIELRHLRARVALAPVWVGLASPLLLRERPGRSLWVGLTLALTGSVVIAGGSGAVGSRPLLGNVLALSSALTGAVYFLIGRRLRV